MAQTESQYVLATGDEAARRLKVLHGVHGPDTERLLKHVGIAPGMRVADLGCGVGVISRWMARQVAPGGEVVGLDVSAKQVATAEEESRWQGITSVRFVVAPADQTGLPRAAFDLVYCRFLLMHVPDPMACLREMRDLVKPGGLLVCEEGDFTSPFCWPESAAYDRSFEVYRALGERRGLDFQIGRRLYRMFQSAGLKSPEISMVQPIFARGEEKRLPEWTFAEFAPLAVEAGIATQDEIDGILHEMDALAEDESVVFGMARMTQVWARKTDGASG